MLQAAGTVSAPRSGADATRGGVLTVPADLRLAEVVGKRLAAGGVRADHRAGLVARAPVDRRSRAGGTEESGDEKPLHENLAFVG
ncbi:MAG: hypothetical protein A3J66_04510 [Candidatus Magasanikbacteria bacterium RIFCSPHIGHO2_02_FULL_47_14]|uniref:Uncharacterized protein n=1 Tax=Candidatus Magasanikbacteria bacterium RIFCSPHIGHO2_02_FULL_47_14 TaxID=1798680 RepID=A0A1F6M4K6_9BACT|nr:MAG: hypothetical protein A3J66_04510 [Candidatus Magasanikbacteria bacterium RIFCSPHIGHO2_02_FULL_47_14]